MASEVITGRPVRLRDYRYQGEVISLAATFFTISTLYAVAALIFPTTWNQTIKAFSITLSGLAVYFISVKLQQRSAFGTLVRVSPRQFPEIYELACVAAERLSSPRVPVYVKRSSEMNIYTLGLWQRPLVVLTSSLVDQMTPDSLQFFIGREIGHVQAGHTWLRTLLKPLGSDVPIIGRLLNSVIFGDWMNRTEFTADRAGFIACHSLTTAISTMLKFGVGVRLYEKLDIREFLEQLNDVGNVRGHLTEIVAEQPYLTRRVRALVRFALSPQFYAIVPENRERTGILKDIPTAFIATSGLRAAVAEAEEVETRAATAAAGVAEKLAPQPEARDEAITISDFEPHLEADPNAPDPHLLLVPVDGEPPHVLRHNCTRIGRTRDNDIVIESDRVSREHAAIIRENGQLQLVDKQSRNGVWLNGERINDVAPLKPGDLIRIGRHEFTFTIKE